MNIWVFPLGLVALVLAALLRAPDRGAPARSVLFFLIGLTFSALSVRVLISLSDIGRPTDFDYFIADAVGLAQEEPDAPVILFSGASFSRNALDDDRLTNRLRDAGLPHRVVNLSLEGSSLQERHNALKRYLKRVKTPPEMVFLMVAPEFDQDAAYVFRGAKFSDRAIAQTTPEAVAWSTLGLMAGACDGIGGCIKSTALTPAHLVLNVLNVGVLSGGRNLSDVSPLKAYDAREDVREAQSDDAIEQGVAANINPTAQRGPHWAASFRSQQRADLEAAGVALIGYYMPPVVAPEIREYTASLCLGELFDWPCIAPTDSALLEQLTGQVWFDPKHLKKDGADIYTDWLADEIITRGLIE